MRKSILGAALAVAVLPVSFARAQAPEQVMLATEQYLFVIRGTTLCQLDVHTLALLNQTTLPPITRTAAGQLAAPGSDRVVAQTATILEEPPPPPQEPAPPAAIYKTAVENALHWLVAHQDDDGKWDCDGFMKHDTGVACDGPGNPVHDVAVTGLAMLAMLGGGSTLRSGPHKEPLKKAVSWLRQQQGENGLFGAPVSHDYIYDHAIAAYAMSEAFGLSKYEMLKPSAQKGIDYLESHRNPYSVWRYQPRDNDNDTSVTTWAILACASASNFGLDVNREAMKIAKVWYDQVTTPDGRAGYTKAGERSSRMPGDHATRFPVENGEAMTAAAMFGRLMLGQSPTDTIALRAGADLLRKTLPKWEPGRIDAVYWYFGTFAMFWMGGADWQAWRGTLDDLVAHQRQDGNAAGSWDPIGVWDETGGRVYVTALYALSLEAAHRSARLAQR